MNKSIRKLIKTDQVLYTIGLNEDLTKEGFASFASADVYCLPVCNSEGNIVGMLDHVRLNVFSLENQFFLFLFLFFFFFSLFFLLRRILLVL